MEKDLSTHWDQVYANREIENLGWYEESPEPSMRLIGKCKLTREASIFHAGAGASTLVDALLSEGFMNIIANDISFEAIDKLKKRLGPELSQKITWIVDDIIHPTELNLMKTVDLWHDRAVLHFFTQRIEQEAYFNLLRKKLSPGGYAVIAAFNLQGAIKCSGLPVHRYDQHMLQRKLGISFTLLEAFDYTYTMPSGDSREYVYTLFQRKTE